MKLKNHSQANQKRRKIQICKTRDEKRDTTVNSNKTQNITRAV